MLCVHQKWHHYNAFSTGPSYQMKNKLFSYFYFGCVLDPVLGLFGYTELNKSHYFILELETWCMNSCMGGNGWPCP